jgi:cephalosporin hydroxylase
LSFDRAAFEENRRKKAREQGTDPAMQELALRFIVESDRFEYAYQWTWLGLPVIQLPQDVLAIQEIIWNTKPDVIIETGVAWGGSLALYATLLNLAGGGRVVGVDLNLHDHVADQIHALPVGESIELIKGDSVAPSVVEAIANSIESGEKVMVVLDSHHSHDHVLAELRSYAPLVTRGQYLVVSDTIVEYMPAQTHRPRPWGPGNNPKTAVDAFLEETDDFEEDLEITHRLLTSFNAHGYLIRVG